MAALPYMQLYIADYLADTMHLSTEEHGAYLLLMFNYWQTGRAIPKNRLAKIARLSNDRWSAVEPSLKEFFNDNGIEWVHERIERDLEAVRSSVSQKSAAGKASAKARKAKKPTEQERGANDRSTGVDIPSEQDANGNSTNKDPDPDIDTDLKERERDERAPEEIQGEESPQDMFVPPPGKFTITPSWKPAPEFERRAALWGIILGEAPGYTPEELQQFRDYWSVEGRVKHHQQWEQTFAQSLRSQREQAKRNTGRQKATAFAIPQPDNTIPDGFTG
ncbi:DUF1376 domain-containing protein [Atlantibacter hermannii]|uniref:DUF1376 domain-containing protein n=1 Tax=Atlantibacter hermannii TaxID=565 RepID=UPI0028A85CF7|nr:DUF1376 domain-containing protein [Atlantibacter hermannii]